MRYNPPATENKPSAVYIPGPKQLFEINVVPLVNETNAPIPIRPIPNKLIGFLKSTKPITRLSP